MSERDFLSSKRIKAIEERLEALSKEIARKFSCASTPFILDNSDFMRLFHISSRTSKYWREQGLIAYSHIKGKIYYKLNDIQALLDRHRWKPRKTSKTTKKLLK